MTTDPKTRRAFLRRLGLSAAALPFLPSLSAYAAAPNVAGGAARPRKQRLVVVFSPDGVVPTNFWPDEVGEKFTLKESLTPLAPFQDKTLLLHGVHDKVRGDGDGHMRGIGCLLTGIELFPGNVQGGSDTPAGWSSGISIDQEIANYLQKNSASRTRFGSLEFGVMVPDRADTWTRLSYAGPNHPIAPIDDPYQMFGKLYGHQEDQATLRSVLDDVRADLATVRANVSAEDRQILDEHTAYVRSMEQELQAGNRELAHAVPVLEPGVHRDNDRMPEISRMQIELMVNSFAADFTRVATLQYTNSVGQAKMRWLGVEEGQHDLSHLPDSDTVAQAKLTKINRWYAEQVAYLAKRLSETPEPGGGGSLLDNTLIVWTNELGKGNSHTPENIPFVLLGGGAGFKMGRSLQLGGIAHNRLLLALGHAYGVPLATFGNPKYCVDGALTGL